MYSPTSTAVVVLASVLPILSSIAVALRFKARSYSRAGYSADDYIILAALITFFGVTAFLMFDAIVGGVGDSERNISSHPAEAANFAKNIWAAPMVGATVLALIKISTLVFYKRIFILPRFLLACNITIGVTLGWFLAYIFGQIFSSKPVSRAWTSTGQSTINEPIFQLSMGAINMSLDFIIVCLPLFVIRSLHMTSKRKWSVVGMFSLGYVCVITSIIRLYYLVHLATTPKNPKTSSTSDIALLIVWSYIENCTSMITACLPTLAPLLRNDQGSQTMLQSLFSLFTLHSSLSKASQSRKEQGGGGDNYESKSAQSAWHKLPSNPSCTTKSDEEAQ